MYAPSFVLAKILLALSDRYPEETVEQWFEDVEVIECSDDKIVLYSPLPNNQKILQENCFRHIVELAKSLLGCNAIVEIWGSQELEKHKQSQMAKPDYLKPEYLFSNFVVGSSNEMAVKAAKAAISYPGNEVYNPLFIYGPSGVGKTHLLWAIANEIHINNPKINICCVQSDRFIGELIWGLRNGTYDDFRNKYRSLDVLIVEDIQFLAGKIATQEEFYTLFDYMYQNHKRLIFSANCCPASISGLEHYLGSKFEQGLVIGIDTPDFQIRKEIITQLDQAYSLGLDSEAILYITETITNSIRKIVGVMKRLRAARDIEGATLTINQVKLILADFKEQ